MLGRLNHVAIAVRDAEKAAKIYGGAFGAEISGAVPLPEHGVITVFVTLPNTKIEFIQPLGEASPIAKFVERNADGGIHHICYDVQAGAVFPPEGFFRRTRRNRTGLNPDGLQHLHRACDLLRALVGRAVRDAAVRRPQPA